MARSEPGSAKVPRRLLPAEAGSRSPEHPGVLRRGERVTSWRRWTLLRLVLAFAFGWAGDVGSGQLAIWGRGAAFAGPGEIFTQVSVGGDLVMALRPDGSVVARGWDSSGEATERQFSGVSRVAMASTHFLLLHQDGTLSAHGQNDGGQLDVPPGLGRLKAVATGGSHSVALREDGTVVAWGAKGAAQRSVPAGLTKVVAAVFTETNWLEVSEVSRSVRIPLVRSVSGDPPPELRVRYRLEGREWVNGEHGLDARAAQPGVDYLGSEGVVEFGPGVMRQTVEVTIPNNATLDGPRAFSFLLGMDAFGEAGENGQGGTTVVIRDDERDALWQEVIIRPHLGAPAMQRPVLLAREGGKALLLDGARAFQWTPSGVPDLDFGAGTGQANAPLGSNDLRTVRTLPDGRLVFIQSRLSRILRWTAAGVPDPTFGNGQGSIEVPGRIHQVLDLTRDGELTLTAVSDAGRVLLRRFRADGQPDPDFHIYDLGPAVGIDSDPSAPAPYSVLRAADKRLWVTEDGRLRRLEANGALDSTFVERRGIRRCFGFDGRGRVYCQLGVGEGRVFGDESQGGLIRFTADGAYDRGYRPTAARTEVRSAEVGADGATITVIGESVVEFDPDGTQLRQHRVQFPCPCVQGQSTQVVSARRDSGGRLLLDVRDCHSWYTAVGAGIECQTLTAHFVETDGSLDLELPLHEDSLSRWIWDDSGGPGPDGTLADGARIWRRLKPNSTPQAGFPTTGAFVTTSAVRVPICRSGETGQAASIRGRVLRWGRGRWDEATAVPFNVLFHPGSGVVEAELVLPNSPPPPPVGEYLVRMEGASGVELSVLRECRLWAFRDDALPTPGQVAMVNPTGPDTPHTVWLAAHPKDGVLAYLRWSPDLGIPAREWKRWMPGPRGIGPIWLEPIPTELPMRFFRPVP